MQVLLVGGGRMGGALVHGWLETGIGADAITIVDPAPPEDISALRHDGVVFVQDGAELRQGYAPDVIVFAVKPQVIGQILGAYEPFAREKTVFLSIAAGITITRLAEALGRRAAIVRAMPNTPAAVGSGITVLCASKKVSRGQREICQSLMTAVGETAWIDDEAMMDAVTGVSGSGPAYVFLLVDALATAGIEAGLPEELAMRLARATVIGSGDLLRQARETATQLRQNVTSPGGTTSAALEVLMSDDGLADLMTRAVRQATDRSRELAGA